VARGGLVEEDTLPTVLDGDAAGARERDGVRRVQPRGPEDYVDVGVERQAVGVDCRGERRPDGEGHAAGVSDGNLGAVRKARGGGALQGAQMQVMLACERFTHEHQAGAVVEEGADGDAGARELPCEDEGRDGRCWMCVEGAGVRRAVEG
jgi:hypothetical protein